MSLSRSPSPHPAGGWSTPGLTPSSGNSTARGYSPSSASLAPGGISWAAAKAKSTEVRGYPSFSTRNSGFFSRQKHKISARFPGFRGQSASPHGYVDKDVYGCTHWKPGRGDGRSALGRFLRRRRARLFLGLFLLWLGYLCFWSCKWQYGCSDLCGLRLNVSASSSCSSIQTLAPRRWPQICDYPWIERRGWRDGVEGRARMGDRAQQHLE